MATDLKLWIEARKRFRLSDAQIQMARELGLNPKKFGSLANHRQEPWKAPLPEFIEEIYFKRFGKAQPDQVRSIETLIKEREKKKTLRREAKQKKLAQPSTAASDDAPDDALVAQPDQVRSSEAGGMDRRSRIEDRR